MCGNVFRGQELLFDIEGKHLGLTNSSCKAPPLQLGAQCPDLSKTN